MYGLLIYAALEGIEGNFELAEKFVPDRADYAKLPENLSEAANIAESSEFLKRYINEDLLKLAVNEAKTEWKEYSSEYDKEL